ncbi:MAG: hypothetical protein A4E57_02226 [Syntrophorhabdaceae bacterium PtaU1.Bin034]|nr:MAG: hypothetical protein A4E57_02226 [Syntrophorhabdaceae bacterium PtaU1.Bin034]
MGDHGLAAQGIREMENLFRPCAAGLAKARRVEVDEGGDVGVHHEVGALRKRGHNTGGAVLIHLAVKQDPPARRGVAARKLFDIHQKLAFARARRTHNGERFTALDPQVFHLLGHSPAVGSPYDSQLPYTHVHVLHESFSTLPDWYILPMRCSPVQ